MKQVMGQRYGWGMALVVAAGIGLSLWAARMPAPQMADDAPDFSSARALADLRVIASEPHPTGTPAAARVRDALLQRLQALGLQDVQVQRGDAIEPRSSSSVPLWNGGSVENVMGRLPGQRRDLAPILLMAHYDSVPGSPGAADDGIGVVVWLEVLRLLRAQPPLRDVIVLLTDGEEAGLLGALAFFAAHPWAQTVGGVINLEARGSSGRAMMFETGPGNAAVVAGYAAYSRQATANSLMSFVYQRMPNGTDFSVPAAQGIPGLNFALIGTQFDYHSPTATVDTLDRGSVQHMGEQALAAVRALAMSDAALIADADLVYSDVLGSVVLAYPPAWGWLLLALIAAALGLAWRRLPAERGGDVLAGAGLMLLIAAVVALNARLSFRLLGGGDPSALLEDRSLMAQFSGFQWTELTLALAAAWGLPALAGRGVGRWGLAAWALAAAIACSAFGAFDWAALVLGVLAALLGTWVLSRPRAGAALAVGALNLVALLALALQVMAPALTPLMLWPALLGAGVVALTVLPKQSAWVMAVAIAMLGVGHVGHFADQTFAGIGFGLPEVLAVPALLVAMLGMPWAVRSPLLMPAAVLAVGLVLAAAVWISAGASVRWPEAGVIYAVDTDAGAQSVATPLPAPDSWTERALRVSDVSPVALEVDSPLAAAWIDRGWWAALSSPVAPAPRTALASRSTADGLSLRLQVPEGTRELRLLVSADVAVTQASMQGHPLAWRTDAGKVVRLRWAAPPQAGVELTLQLAMPGEVRLRAAAIRDAWPTDFPPLPLREPTQMPWGWSDAQLVIDDFTIAWPLVAEPVVPD